MPARSAAFTAAWSTSEWMTAMRKESAVLAGDFGDNLPAPGHVRRRACAAGRAHDHRHAQPQALDEHELQIALDQRAIGERLAAAEVVRPRIGRAGVAGDQVRPPLDAAAERLFREAVSQDGRRRKDAESWSLALMCHVSRGEKKKHHGDTENTERKYIEDIFD